MMVRLAATALCCVVLVPSVISGPVWAQRPAAWDTRVRAPAPPPPEPQDNSDALQHKDQAKKPADTPADTKANKPKPN